MHRIELQRRSSRQDASGQHVETWDTYRVCSAALEHQGGGETTRAGTQVVAIGRAVWTMRVPAMADEMPTAADRIVGAGSVWHLESVSPADDRGRWLRLDATLAEGATP